MVLNPGQLPPPALRLALPRASSHAPPGDAGRVFPGAVRRVRPRSPQPQPARCQGLWITHNESPQSVPLAAFLGGSWRVPALCAPRGTGCEGLRGSGSRRLNTPGLGVCVHGGMGVSRGECACEQRKGRLVKTLFSPFIFLFFSLYFFFRGGCCRVAWHE